MPVIIPLRSSNLQGNTLYLRVRSSESRNYGTLILLAVTTAFMIFAGLYMINATVQSGPFLPLPYQSSNSAIVTAGFLFLLSSIFLQQLNNSVCNDIRWRKGMESEGIPALDFVVLDPSTSIIGLIQLVISKESIARIFPVSELKILWNDYY